MRKFLCATTAALALIGVHQADARDVRISMAAEPATVEPITGSELNSMLIYANIYEPLVALAEDGSLVPGLAESWEILPETNTIRYHLRRGVKFHSGADFNAEAVRATYEALLNAEGRAGIAGTYAASIAGAEDFKSGAADSLGGVKIVDDYTVEVTLGTPNSVFIAYPILIIDPSVYDPANPSWYMSASAGTGPFRFAGWQRGTQVRLAANPDYWGGAPEVEGLDYLIVPDPSTALTMYRAGELDVMPINSGVLRQIQRDDELSQQIKSAPSTNVSYLSLNGDLYEPFRDPRVREAFCLSISQDELITGLYMGAAIRMDGPVPPIVPGASTSLPTVAHDPDRARQLLAEAGYADGKGMPPLRISMMATQRMLVAYIASKVQETLGVPVEIETLERSAMLGSMNARQLPMFTWGWSLNYMDAMNYLGDLWYGPSPYNKGWQNDEYDALIQTARATYDDARRFPLYDQAQQILMREWGMCPLPSELRSFLARPEVEGISYLPNSALDYRKARLAE